MKHDNLMNKMKIERTLNSDGFNLQRSEYMSVFLSSYMITQDNHTKPPSLKTAQTSKFPVY